MYITETVNSNSKIQSLIENIFLSCMCTFGGGKKQIRIPIHTHGCCNCLVPAKGLITNNNKATSHKKY